MSRLDKQGRFVPPIRVNVAADVDLVRHTYVADTVALLKGLKAGIREEGQIALVTSNGSRWRFSAASTAVDTTNNFVLTPTAGTGRWLRTDQTVMMKLAIAFGTADAATLFTVPAGFTLKLTELFFEVTTNWAGGSSSAIGVSSADAPHSTQGDLLGGAAGTVAAELTTTIGYTGENVGANLAAAPFVAVLVATDTIRFDRITSAFTSGVGFVHVLVNPIVG